MCYARLLNRSGYGVVMPFVIPVPYRYLIPKSTAPVNWVPLLFPFRQPYPLLTTAVFLLYVTKHHCFYPAHKNKSPANPLCILHRSPAVQSLPISVFHLRSTRSRLACSSRTSFHKLHSFRKTSSCSPCCHPPSAALKAVLP